MDLATLIAKVQAIIAAVRAGGIANYIVAVKLVIELIAELASAFPSIVPDPAIRMAASPAKTATMAACEAKTSEDLCNDLDALCQAHAPVAGNVSAAPTGPFIDKLLPILLALIAQLKAWFGF